MQPLSPFHIGERGVGIEEAAALPRSDTMFAALASAWRLMYGAERLEKLLLEFPINGVNGEAPAPEPPVRLSSAFPYAGGVQFLPRPLFHLDGAGEDAKTGKQVEWVSWDIMRTLIQSAVPLTVDREDLIQGRRLWLSPTDHNKLPPVAQSEKKVWFAGDEAMVPRVALDRRSSASNLFFQGQVRFQEDCGLYLLAQFAGPKASEYKTAVEDGLNLLGELGLGGRRSVGLGRFALQEPEPVVLPSVGGSDDLHFLLSLYHPTPSEVSPLAVLGKPGMLDDARYQLIQRRGWLSSPDGAGLRRKSLRMLTEGSIVGWKPTGDIANLRPEPVNGVEFPHAVYRSGIALSLPCARWRGV